MNDSAFFHFDDRSMTTVAELESQGWTFTKVQIGERVIMIPHEPYPARGEVA